MMITSTQKIIASVGIFALVIAAIVSFVIVPTAKNIKSMADDASNLRNFLEKRYQQSVQARLTKQKIKQVASDAADFQNYLFNASGTLMFIQNLEDMAAKNRVTQTMNATSQDQITAASKIGLSIDASGKYSDILKYLYSLDKLSYFLDIDQLSLAPASSASGKTSPSVNLIVSASLYVSH